MNDLKPRLAASRALAHAIADNPDTAPDVEHVIIALQDDTVADIIRRAMNLAATPPVEIAIYWPDTERLERMVLGPGEGAASEQFPANKTSVGMLFDYMASTRHSSLTFSTVASTTSLRIPA